MLFVYNVFLEEVQKIWPVGSGLMTAGVLTETYMAVQQLVNAGKQIRPYALESQELIYLRCLGGTYERSVYVNPLLGFRYRTYRYEYGTGAQMPISSCWSTGSASQLLSTLE